MVLAVVCLGGLAEELVPVGQSPGPSSAMAPGHSRKTHAFSRKGAGEVVTGRDGLQAVFREEVAFPIVLVNPPWMEVSA